MNFLVGTWKTSVVRVSAGVAFDVGDAGWGVTLTVDFFESELLGLADEAEDHEPGNEVQASVEADC